MENLAFKQSIIHVFLIEFNSLLVGASLFREF